MRPQMVLAGFRSYARQPDTDNLKGGKQLWMRGQVGLITAPIAVVKDGKQPNQQIFTFRH